MQSIKTTQPQRTNPLQEVRAELLKMESQFKMVLPEGVTPDKFIRVTLTALQNTPELMACDRQSLFSAAMKCAADGLLPDGREAAFVKFNSKQGPKVQYMPMVYGIYKKVRQSGEIVSFTSKIVNKNDKFRYWVDSDGEHIEHEPLLFGDRGDRIGVYALAKLKDGGVEIEPMTEAEVMAVRDISKTKDSGPWSGPFEGEMWRKTSIRRLSKRLPMSTEAKAVIERDDELYELKNEPKSKAVEFSEKLSLEAPKEEDGFENFSGESLFSEEKATDMPLEESKLVK